jgi:hypothetical protein
VVLVLVLGGEVRRPFADHRELVADVHLPAVKVQGVTFKPEDPPAPATSGRRRFLSSFLPRHLPSHRGQSGRGNGGMIDDDKRP